MSKVKPLISSPLTAFTDQNEAISRTASDPRYPITSQAIGPLSSDPTWRRGRPWKRSASLRPTDLFSAPAPTPAASTACHEVISSAHHPLISVQAETQSL